MIPTMNIAPAGDHAMLIELDRSIAAADLHAAVANVRARLDKQIEEAAHSRTLRNSKRRRVVSTAGVCSVQTHEQVCAELVILLDCREE